MKTEMAIPPLPERQDIYASPCVEVLQVAVEQGFIESDNETYKTETGTWDNL